jgi:hypothetical protein
VRSSLLCLLVICATLLAGCASTLEGLGRTPSTDAFGRELAIRHLRGDISNAEAQRVARRFLQQTIRDARGDAGQVTLAALGGCTARLDAELRARGETHDDVGADALLQLAEDGDASRADWSRFETDPSPRYRRLFAITLDSIENGPKRRKLLADPAPDVRLGALVAALAAHDASDMADLLDMARREPIAHLRLLALRAFAELPPTPHRADELADLYAVGDLAQRSDIALAWTLPPLFALGGRSHLIRLLERASDESALLAAAVALTLHGSEDRELAVSAEARLLAALRAASPAAQLRAVQTAPLREPFLAELKHLATLDASLLQVAADLRLAVVVDPAAVSRKRLWERARDPGEVGLAARLGLAQLGELRVQAWLESDLVTQDDAGKLAAMYGLIHLKRAARGLPLLRDPQVGVRAACVMLHAE